MAAASECWSYDEKHGEAMIQIECSYHIHLHIYISSVSLRMVSLKPRQSKPEHRFDTGHSRKVPCQAGCLL